MTGVVRMIMSTTARKRSTEHAVEHRYPEVTRRCAWLATARTKK